MLAQDIMQYLLSTKMKMNIFLLLIIFICYSQSKDSIPTIPDGPGDIIIRDCPIICPLNSICVNGKCIKTCATILCKLGWKCIDGQCVPIGCTSNSQCNVNQICLNGKCIPRLCPLCRIGYHCVNGVCVPITKCSTNAECPKRQKCYGGACVPLCTGILCHPFTKCVDGICVDQRCINIKCPIGTRCVYGQCIRILPPIPCIKEPCPKIQA